MLLALLLLPSGLLGFQLPLADPRYSPAIFTPLSPFLYNFPQFPQPVLYTGQVRQDDTVPVDTNGDSVPVDSNGIPLNGYWTNIPVVRTN